MAGRRQFLAALGALAATRAAAALPFRRARIAPVTLFPVYFGTDTNKGGAQGIYRGVFNTRSGQLSQITLAAHTLRPTFLAIAPAPKRRVLYAVNAIPDDTATISGFTIDPHGALHEIGKISSGGAGPAYIAVDATVHAAFVANYIGGTVTSYRIAPDGALAGPVERLDYNDTTRFGENGPRQDGPHPHSAVLSPDDRFLLVNDLGHDRISIFSVDPATAKLTANEPHLFSNNRPGSGPRHLAFHPNGRWVYTINELDSTVDHFLWNTTHGAHPQALLTLAGPPVKTIADDFPTARNAAAELVIAPNGYYLYASNRGEDTLAVFAIDQDNGALKLIQRIPCGGKAPRHFTLDPTGDWLLCENQDSDSVTVFRRNPGTGQLSGPNSTIPIPAPVFALFL